MNTATAKLEKPSLTRIATLESLREHLQWAIELEHFTLPPWICVRSTHSTLPAIPKLPRSWPVFSLKRCCT